MKDRTESSEARTESSEAQAKSPTKMVLLLFGLPLVLLLVMAFLSRQ